MELTEFLDAAMWAIIAGAMFLSIARISCLVLGKRLFFCEDNDANNR